MAGTFTITFLTDDEAYPVRPDQITWEGRHGIGKFGKHQPEFAAIYILRLCQQRGGWKPFTWEEVQAVFQSDPHTPRGEKFDFAGLERPLLWDLMEAGTRGAWIVKMANWYYISTDFVDALWEEQQERPFAPVS